MKKNIIVLLLALCEAVIISSCGSAPKAIAPESDFEVTVENEAVIITKYTGSGGSVIIPARIQGLPVTSIGKAAFRECTSLTSIGIPASVTSIGVEAFWRCTGLTSISSIPAGVTSIEAYAFSYCTSLTSVSIPASVTSIGYWAFTGCTSLTSINIPASVISIGNDAFRGCTSLADISVDQRNPSYTSRDGVLFNKTGDTLIKYPAEKKEKHYAIPAGVTNIVALAFSGCTDLTSISIPTSVTRIGEMAFYGCTELTGISVDPRNPSYIDRDGVLFNKTGDTLIKYPAEKKEKHYAIPTGVTSIDIWAFSDCPSLTSISMPAGVTSIGIRAFSGCTGLTSISIPESVTSIGNWAFYGCRSLTSINIPAKVTSIANYAFHSCTSLASIRIGANVTLGSDVFPNELDAYYNTNGKKAGVYTYTFRNGAWSYTAR